MAATKTIIADSAEKFRNDLRDKLNKYAEIQNPSEQVMHKWETEIFAPLRMRARNLGLRYGSELKNAQSMKETWKPGPDEG